MRLGKRLNTASSKSNGRLEAANTTTRSLSLVVSPSHMEKMMFLIFRIASCSLEVPAKRINANKKKKNKKKKKPLFPSKLSTSSMKTTHGLSLDARVKIAWAYFSPSPNHFDPTEAAEMLMKFAPPVQKQQLH